MPPALPQGLADPRPAVGIGTAIWFASALVLLVVGGSAAWIWACLAGGLLGFVGFAMIHWQRQAARRGSRSAQRGVLIDQDDTAARRPVDPAGSLDRS